MRVYHDAPLTSSKYKFALPEPRSALMPPSCRVLFQRCQLRRELCDAFCSDRKRVLDLCHVKRVGKYLFRPALLEASRPHKRFAVVPSVDSRPDLHKSFGMIWRFAPMLDDRVDEWHSRDLDALILPREVEAVREWASTNYTYHVMRDHPDHATDILGGMFGARQATPGQKARSVRDFDAMVGLLRERWQKGSDQVALSVVVAPRAAKDSLIHDSYFCNTFFIKGRTVPFPTRRVSGPNFTRPDAPNFVGNIGTYGEAKVCPPGCRPREHQDWLLC